MFAVVDIETTGGYASANGITEIAIVLHDGKEIEGKFTTLVNPNVAIPPYIRSLTGITDQMVAKAPQFETIAPHIFNLLKDRIFVAHNVNFDYSFVKHHLAAAGFNLNTQKLCTIRSARKIFPGLPKYGLDSICRELNINIADRHRATGDALATTRLLEMLIESDIKGEIKRMMKGRNSEQYLPPNLTTDRLHELPNEPGVYYFHNNKQKVVYVGKAKDLRKRVTSHFSNNKPTKQKQAFLRDIHNITYKTCSSEFVAGLFESIEIKRLWPTYNKSQKHFEHQFGIYMFEDAKGYQRLAIDKKRTHLKPLLSFGLMADAHRKLWKLVNEHGLHPTLCFLDKQAIDTNELPNMETYNMNVTRAVDSIKIAQKTYMVHDGASNYILVEEGKFYGMAAIEKNKFNKNISTLKPLFTPYAENEMLRSMLSKYIEKYPARVISF